MVIADEAHRRLVRLDRRSRQQPPRRSTHASLISVTGTPFEKTDGNTRAILRQLIAIYEIQHDARVSPQLVAALAISTTSWWPYRGQA